MLVWVESNVSKMSSTYRQWFIILCVCLRCAKCVCVHCVVGRFRQLVLKMGHPLRGRRIELLCPCSVQNSFVMTS